MSISIKSIKRWTNIAKFCYERGCICDGCLYNSIVTSLEQKCCVKKYVIESVRLLGRPKDVITKKIIPEFKGVLK